MLCRAAQTYLGRDGRVDALHHTSSCDGLMPENHEPLSSGLLAVHGTHELLSHGLNLLKLNLLCPLRQDKHHHHGVKILPVLYRQRLVSTETIVNPVQGFTQLPCIGEDPVKRVGTLQHVDAMNYRKPTNSEKHLPLHVQDHCHHSKSAEPDTFKSHVASSR